MLGIGLKQYIMYKQNLTVQQKVLSFKTLSKSNNDEVVKFMLADHAEDGASSSDDNHRLHAATNLIMIPILRSEWSFGLYEDDNLVGVYLQIDLLKYLNIVKSFDSKLISALFGIAQFEQDFSGLFQNLKRGECLLTVFNSTKLHKSNVNVRKEISLIHQGLYLCKIGGWKNIIFPTSNPIPFLKIGADVVGEGTSELTNNKNYLMRINMTDFNLLVNPFRKVYAKL